MTSFGSLKSTIFDRQEKKQHYQAYILGLNAYDRHKKFLNDYVGFYGKEKFPEEKLPIKTDQDTLREGYRFIRSEEDDIHPSWEQRLVKRYYDKLFKEYCIADMSQYKTGKIGLRWRTEKELISVLLALIFNNEVCISSNLCSKLQVNFSYFEAGENKQALVKLVTCERCAKKLVYRKEKEKEQLKRREKEEMQRKRGRSESDDDMKNENERSKERKKGKRALTSKVDQLNNVEDDENFDEYLVGMFP
ncbi:hypothetical protein LguiB_011207 [Lonicera macranthoides]